MKFVLFVIDTESNSGSNEEMLAIDAFNEKLKKEERLVVAEGITSPNNAYLIDNRSGANQLTPGSLHDLREYVSGFWIFRADDLTHAQKLALEASMACNRKVELRALFGA